jgi:hypothetical protein
MAHIHYKSILFICVGEHLKDSDDCGYAYGKHRPAGLYVSDELVVNMLKSKGVRAAFVQAVDNNDIDRLVFAFKPDVVVIEALWVVPEKFDVLKRLHPKVKWTVRLHSEVPFLAMEGIAMEWINAYRQKGVEVTTNSHRLQRALAYATGVEPPYTPNYYNPDLAPRRSINYRSHGVIDVGCFGATRPLKNQLIQAMAAIRFADQNKLKLRFHINATRKEPLAPGDSILRNLRALFAGPSVKSKGHFLVEHGWYSHKDFLAMLHHIDIGMQVSLSETFNLVTADTVAAGVPILVSPEVGWAAELSKVNPTDISDIVSGLNRVYWLSRHGGTLEWRNSMLLRSNSAHAAKTWLAYLRA